MLRYFSREGGMQTFLLIWFGQLVSLSGTAMTRFALLTWAYQQTRSATTLALLGFFSFILFVLVSPVAGVLVDRWDRRIVMIYTDLGAGLMTVSMLVLYASGDLQIWHLYVAEALTGAFEAFQIPAYTAATSVLVPKHQYGRANGLRSLAHSSSQVVAPFLAGLMLVTFDLSAVMLFDIATFLIAMSTLIIVRIPRPTVSTEGEAAGGSFGHQVRFGFTYIFQRRGLLFLMLMFAGMNFTAALTYFGILPAMILARTGGSELALASVQSALGIGGIVGGILVSVWGGPKRRIHGILLYAALSFLLGDFLLGTGQSVPVWVIGGFIAAVFIPFIVTCDRVIWQSKIPPDVQGRVFAVQNLFRQGVYPIGYLITGPLADRVFEPALMPGGALAETFGGLVGTGPGAGMGLMFVCTSIIGMTFSLSGYLIPAVRNVETDLPDHDAQPAVKEAIEDLTVQPVGVNPA